MRQYLTAADIANQIRMTRTQYFGSFLVVEGDSDEKLYRNFIDRPACSIIIAHSKDNAVQVVRILENSAFSGVLAIVDADFWLIEGSVPSSPNILLTDTHDLETMLLKSPAFEKILHEYGSEEKLNKIKDPIPTLLMMNGLPIGYLRWYSLKNNLALRFEEISYGKFVNKDTFAIDVLMMIRTVKNHSQMHSYQDDVLHEGIVALHSDQHDVWHVCCGHDLINILAIGLHKVLGTNNSQEVAPNIIERSLRLAYEFSFFQATDLYHAIRAWESANPPYIVLKSA